MAKKYDNTSMFFRDWTTGYLKEQARQLDELINGVEPCFGVKDVMTLDHILDELDNRGIATFRQLRFTK